MRYSKSYWFMAMAALMVTGCGTDERPDLSKRQPQGPQPAVSASATDKDKSSNLLASVENASDLASPVRLEADGEPIDIGKLSSIAHAGPWIADVDGDGDRDLLVGDFPGFFWLFENNKNDEDPQYTSQGKLQAGGVDAKTPVYWCIASSPQFVDYDNDGILDFISGSYDPGDVYLFRGLGNGKYAAIETILDEDDQPLVHHPVEFARFTKMKDDDEVDGDESIQMRVASFGSWAAPVDWDADGDLDILIGSFSGELFLRSNIGTREEPKYSRESIAINANGKPIKETGHANPVVADWDGDGMWDLVIGSSDGSVGWYRNTGSVSQPEFGSRNLLVKPAAENKFLEQNLKPAEDPVPGVRAQICVTDYNGDGLQDLIVGDYSDINWTKSLSKKEQAEFDALMLQQAEMGKSLSELQVIVYGKDSDPELKKEKEPEYREIGDKLMKLDERKKGFYAESRRASFVWLYLRKSGGEASTFVSGDAK